MIALAANMRAKAGKEEELAAVMSGLVKAVRAAEPGALAYTLHRSLKDPRAFLVYEKYRDQAALNAHLTSAHFQEASRKLKDLVDGAPGLEMFEVVE